MCPGHLLPAQCRLVHLLPSNWTEEASRAPPVKEGGCKPEGIHRSTSAQEAPLICGCTSTIRYWAETEARLIVKHLCRPVLLDKTFFTACNFVDSIPEMVHCLILFVMIHVKTS